jgi:hypothetical protein
VIDFQPSLIGFTGCGSGANAFTVPLSGPCFDQALVISPVFAVGGFSHPNVVTADLPAAGPVQCKIFTVDFSLKECAVFIVEWKDKPLCSKSIQFAVVRSPAPTPFSDTAE